MLKLILCFCSHNSCYFHSTQKRSSLIRRRVFKKEVQFHADIVHFNGSNQSGLNANNIFVRNLHKFRLVLGHEFLLTDSRAAWMPNPLISLKGESVWGFLLILFRVASKFCSEEKGNYLRLKGGRCLGIPKWSIKQSYTHSCAPFLLAVSVLFIFFFLLLNNRLECRKKE